MTRILIPQRRTGGSNAYRVNLNPHQATSNSWRTSILLKYAAAGLQRVRHKAFTFTHEQIREFYAEHVDKDFFPGLVEAMCEGETLAVIFEGEDAIQKIRTLNGATNPEKAEAGTIRRDFKDPEGGGPRNTVHGSDSKKTAEREIAIIFKWASHAEALG